MGNRKNNFENYNYKKILKFVKRGNQSILLENSLPIYNYFRKCIFLFFQKKSSGYTPLSEIKILPFII